ncbi:cytosine deaminase [Cnuibacter physcomitrellae]|uniref:Cytosine deaminase n=1 Tax=Cnuibacter physcomitrellae TaxID=1619308 RepID=A0A1X9LRN5_9MICO|nr:amidohydrolase family protein [Cnuibacter physcomitrellae]ARJ05819.1 cytosine deaminase [Cnuibacter physcomitrellae]GGI36560.1 cytosine deaminase [Cnuibacter physcomitrellae]
MTALPRPLGLLAGASLRDGRTVDVVLDGDTVAEVLPAGTAPRPADPDSVLDLEGFLLLPAPAEPHAHLDKALSWDLIRPPMGDLGLAIESWRAYSAEMTVDSIADRARTTALAMLANGTTAIRTHVDLLHGEAPLRGVEALVRVRDELAGILDLELVALAGPTVPDAVVEAALDAGIDLVGGAPHLADDPIADLHRLLAIAERYGVGVDMHTDESLSGAITLDALAIALRDRPAGRVATAGHCVRLGTLEAAELGRIIDDVVAADIGIVTLPITNLYLQGWEHPTSTPRGLTAVRALLDAGVRLGAGADNVRDPFNPVGRGDALETAMLLVTAGHLTLDEAYDAVSIGARSVMGLPDAGVVPGARAELVAVRGASLSDVIATAPADRAVIHAGMLVAQSETVRRIAVPAPRSLVETR